MQLSVISPAVLELKRSSPVKRSFENLNCDHVTYPERWDLLMLLLSLYLMFLFSGNVTNIPAVLQPSSICQWFRLLTVCCQPYPHQPIAFCVVGPTHTSFCSGYGGNRSLWTGSLFGERVKKSRGGGREKLTACRQTFGTVVPRHPLCIRSWCKLLLARPLTVDRFDLHRIFGRHVGLPSSFLVSRSFAARRSCARALPSLIWRNRKTARILPPPPPPQFYCCPLSSSASSSFSFPLLLFRWHVSAFLHFWSVFGPSVALLDHRLLACLII